MSDVRTCPSCGTANKSDARFCGRCGTSLAAPVPAPQPQNRAPMKTMAAASFDPATLAQLQNLHAQATAAAAAPAAAAPAPQAAPSAPAPGPVVVQAQVAGGAFAWPAAPQPAPAPAVLQPMATPPAGAFSAQPHARTVMGPLVPGAGERGLPLSPMSMPPVQPSPASSTAPMGGARVDAAPAAPPVAAPPAAPSGDENKTLLGVDLGAAVAAARAGETSATAGPLERPDTLETPAMPEAARMPLPEVPAPAVAAAPEPAPPGVAAPAPAAPGPMTMPEPVAPVAPVAAAAPSGDPSARTAETAAPVGMKRGPARTMLGMQIAPGTFGLPPAAQAAHTPEPAVPVAPPAPITPPAPVAAAAPPAEPAAPSPAAAHAIAKRAALGPSTRTMLGVATPEMKAAVAAAQAKVYGAEAASASPAAAPVAAAPAPNAYTTGATATGDISIAGLQTPGRRRRGGLVIGLLLAGALSLAALAIGYVVFGGGGGGPAISVSVAHSDTEGELLRVEVPGAADGTRVRFLGAREGTPTELPLAAGRADFPLAPEALHVGDNPLSVDVVDPSGQVTTSAVTLTLAYRVRADLGGLTATPPAIVVVVEAAPGSTAQIDGEAVTLDASGRGERRYPLEGLTPSAEGVVEHVAHYTITPAGGAAVMGSLTTRVPLTTFHVDRPGESVVTDRTSLEIAGAVLPTASLIIDGAPVTILPEGRFLYTLALPTEGERDVRLVASAPGCAPAVRTIHVRRVADLAREAATFRYDASITYARLEPAPQTFIGQAVMFEGRVYNVDVHDGRGVLQMLARDCPSGSRCPLWVNYSAAVEVAVDGWVRVLGTVAGAQQFRSTSGELRTVPSIDATFVLPLPR